MIVGVISYPRGHQYSRVPRISTPQDGVFNRAQARAHGFTRGAVNHKVKYGLWVPVAGAGLIERGESITMVQLANAMALTWSDATVIGPSAVRLWYLTAPLPASSTLMCAVAQQRRRQSGLDPRRVSLPPSEVTEWRRGIMIQRRHPALIDSLAWLPEQAANSLFAWIMVRRLIKAENFHALLIPRAGRRGMVRLREYQRWLTSGAASFLEFRVHCLLRTAGIGGWEANAELVLRDGTKVMPDILFRKEKVVIEADGRHYHQSLAAFDNDRIRDNRYHASGYQTLRVTWQMIEHAPDRFLADLRALLALQQRR